MKSLLLSVGLILILSAGYANAALPPFSILSEVWFTDNGHLMVEFSTMGMHSIPLNKIIIIHGGYDVGYREAFQDSTILIDSSAVVIDITERMPNMLFNPEGDAIEIGYLYGDDEENFSWLDDLSWGNGNLVDINPPHPGQSMARAVKWREYYNESWPFFYWVIDEPPTPGTHCYQPVARAVLKVIATDQNNDPVPYVPIYYNIFLDECQTDANGECIVPIYPGSIYVSIRHPITAELLLNQRYWVEPSETLEIPIHITMPGSNPLSKLKKLMAFPVPFNKNSDQHITFRYFGEVKGESYIKLYDAKGRFVTKISVTNSGYTWWKPNRGLKSGIYFAKMIRGNRVIDTTAISIK